jgi:type I restriction enzyme S subunit
MKPSQPPLAHLEPDADFLPSGWSWSRLKYVALVLHSNVDKHSVEGEAVVRLCNYVDVYKNDRITDDLEYMAATASKAQIKRFSLAHDDVVITKDSETPDDIAVPAYVDASAAGLVCGYHLSILRPLRKVVDGRFLYWAIASKPVSAAFSVRAQGITRFGLTVASTGDVAIPLPPLPEQRAIADFLDRETAKIDALIAKQEELIERIDEKRRALITHLVVEGPNPNAQMKANGPRWLGQSPRHWRLLPLRRVVGKFVDYRGSTPEKLDSGVPLITATAIRYGRIDHSRNPAFISPEEYEERMVRGLPSIGDVVMTTEAPLGEVAQIDTLGQGIGQRVILFKLNLEYMLPRMLFYFLLSSAGQGELWSTASGSTAQGIKAERLKGISVVVPPVAEQEAIIATLDKGLAAFEPIEQRAEQEVVLLRERRSALITAAVTGQIEVANSLAGEAAA